MTLAYSALHLLKMVREGRLELPRVTPLEPKSSASTNSATLALIQARHYSRSQPASALSCRKYCAPYCDLASAKKRVGEKWGGRWDLNPRPQESQSCALPTELRSPLDKHFITAVGGAPGRIRTCYPRLRRPMLYPNELRAHNLVPPYLSLRGQVQYDVKKLVGAAGFEPATLCSQSRCATRLRYAPISEQAILRARSTIVKY